jgi:hypothetical protein
MKLYDQREYEICDHASIRPNSITCLILHGTSFSKTKEERRSIRSYMVAKMHRWSGGKGLSVQAQLEYGGLWYLLEGSEELWSGAV